MPPKKRNSIFAVSAATISANDMITINVENLADAKPIDDNDIKDLLIQLKSKGYVYYFLYLIC
jgi:ribonuclease HIII